jgi:hypothetical protein
MFIQDTNFTYTSQIILFEDSDTNTSQKDSDIHTKQKY